MDYFFEQILVSIEYDKVLYFTKFVDDCLFILRVAIVDLFFEACNSIYDSTSFTIQHCIDGSLPSLDFRINLCGNSEMVF